MRDRLPDKQLGSLSITHRTGLKEVSRGIRRGISHPKATAMLSLVPTILKRIVLCPLALLPIAMLRIAWCRNAAWLLQESQCAEDL